MAAMFWRVFLLGEVLVDVQTLNNQLPWGYSAGPSDYPYNRRDLTDTYLTREYFVVSAYKDGEFPFWNPYTMAGHPIYADGVTRTLSPSLLWYALFDVPRGYTIARIIELLLGSIFMYVFLIGIGAGRRGALIGALIFELSAHSMLHASGLGWWGGLMWLPLIILFVDRAVTRMSVTAAVAAGVVLAVQFFFGYLPNQIYYVSVIPLYYLLAWRLLKRSREGFSFGRIVGYAALTVSVGLTLAATQWVPSLELLSYSNRRIVGSELGYIYLPPWYAATLVFPTILGSAYDAKALTLFTALGVSHDHILYIGIAGLVAVIAAVFAARTSRNHREEEGLTTGERPARPARIGIFVWIAVIAAAIMMSAPAYVFLTRYIPILQVIRVAVRAGVLLVFAMAALAGFGTERLLSMDGDSLGKVLRVVRRLSIVCAIVFAAAVAFGYLVRATGFANAEAGPGRMGFVRRAAAYLSSEFTPPQPGLLLPLIFLIATTFLIWWFIRNRRRERVIFASLVLLLVVDLFWNSRQFDKTHDRARVFPRTETTDLLKSLPPGRVLTVPSELETNRRASAVLPSDKIIAPPNTLLPYCIATVTGKNQQFPRWYREYASLIEPQTNLSHVVFDKARSPFFDLLNVKYIVTHDDATISGYELVATAEGLSIYQNPNALPRAFFVSRSVKADNAPDALAELQSLPDLSATAVIEDSGLNEQRFSVGRATLKGDRRNRVLIETSNDGPGLLVMSDNYYPGWRAFIDGQRTAVLRANRTMRAVQIPSGDHVVSFEFLPQSFVIAGYVSIGGAVLVVAGLILSATRKKKERSE